MHIYIYTNMWAGVGLGPRSGSAERTCPAAELPSAAMAVSALPRASSNLPCMSAQIGYYIYIYLYIYIESYIYIIYIYIYIIYIICLQASWSTYGNDNKNFEVGISLNHGYIYIYMYIHGSSRTS